jgi:hypothetical protein
MTITTNKTDIGTFITSSDFISLNKVYEEYVEKYGVELVGSINPIYSEGGVKYQFQVLASFGLEPPIGDFKLERVNLTKYKVTLFVDEGYEEDILKPMSDFYLAMGESEMSHNTRYKGLITFEAYGEAVAQTMFNLHDYKQIDNYTYEIFVKSYKELSSQVINISSDGTNRAIKLYTIGAEFPMKDSLVKFCESLDGKFDGSRMRVWSENSEYCSYGLYLNKAEYQYFLNTLEDLELNYNINTSDCAPALV